MFGPYHLARLAALCGAFQVLGVEISRGSKTYDWDIDDSPVSFDRRTLFDVDDSSSVAFSAIRDRLSAALADFHPDVVLVPGWASRGALAAMRWCGAANVPMIVMSESTAGDHHRMVWKELAKRPLIAAFQGGIVGGAPQSEYLQSLGMPRSSISLGYNVVDNDHFWRESEKARACSAQCRLDYELPQRYLLASARFIPIKNLNVLLESFSIAAKSPGCADLNLVLLGDGKRRGELEAKRAELGLDERISFPGFRQYGSLPTYYGLAEAFVHISTVEPWGLVVNEAMAAGLPVIVSDECGCATTLVEDGRNGFRVPANAAGTIAERICRLGADRQLRARFGRRSREIINQWSPERFASGVLEAATKALEAKPVSYAAMRQVYISVLARVMQ